MAEPCAHNDSLLSIPQKAKCGGSESSFSLSPPWKPRVCLAASQTRYTRVELVNAVLHEPAPCEGANHRSAGALALSSSSQARNRQVYI
eukprot:6206823-Pleurochrysis_carterae.AAC.1